jgi:DNA-binding transcriptional LysR family regulator
VFQLTQLRCFVAVATELHFGRAAASLNMTQPPLTRQIQLLEHEVGVRLLERSGGNVRLTPAGAVFLHEAEDILRRSQAATLAARRAMRADAGSVTMGFIPAASFTLLPQLLAAVQAQLPDVQVVLREMQMVEQIEAIGTDRIELGIVRPFAPRSFTE